MINRGQPYTYEKIAATEPSSALRNAVRIEYISPQQYRGKENIPPILLIYTDGGPEHGTNFTSVKIAIIVLHQSINTDLTIVLCTTPGHFFKNSAKRVNCILNLELYSMGVMKKICIKCQAFKKIASVLKSRRRF